MFEIFGKAVAGIAGTAMLTLVSSFLGGLEIMLGVGAVHGWLPVVPTVGYWSAVLIFVGTKSIFSHNYNPSKGK